eukprot:TRINITY_DN113296_c0_g1_i1.p1 TRINITY_DN113296_c0_g1~~TRINITY_DN113296_c0_g1_i1.p1  ORF type:complete len:405 (-),score=96.79 TRINITY_DN113296_c0_g1_i1:70-1284(-)
MGCGASSAQAKQSTGEDCTEQSAEKKAAEVSPTGDGKAESAKDEAAEKSIFKGLEEPGCALKLTDQILNKYDKNKNGLLEASEMAALLADAYPDVKLNRTDSESWMNALDLDKSGFIGQNELRAFLRCYDPAGKEFKSKSALVIIDVQNDFISGSLANPYKAEDIIPIINGMRDKFDVVVISYDWHPQEHCSFVESVNAGNVPIVEELQEFAPFSMVTLKGDDDRPQHQQCLYPRHAVQESEGGKTHKDLILKDTDLRVNKGTKPNIDSYSAFFDNCKANDTGLTEMLEKEGVTDVYCCGLVLDICVKSTALHGAEMGFRMSVIEDACKPLSQDNVEKTKGELASAGVSVLSAEGALQELEKRKTLGFEEYLKDVNRSRSAKDLHAKLESTLSSHFLASAAEAA